MSKFWQARMMTMMMVVCLLFLEQTPLMAVAELEQIVHKKPMMYELSNRDEMVQMAGYGAEKLSTVLVTGTVLCQSCHLHPQIRAWPISGALVDVKCKNIGKSKSESAQARTDEYGDFMIDLPSHLHGVPNLEKICTVKVIGIPKKSMCRPAFVTKNKRLRFSSVGNGIRTYTAGKIRLRHITSKPLKSCITKKATTNIAKQNSLTI